MPQSGFRELTGEELSVVRFTHSRVQPFFSGCGIRLEDTLEQLTSGRMALEDLPTITVIANSSADVTFFVSLNNRRLWVLKQLHDQGYFGNRTIKVRVKKVLPREVNRYAIDRCVLNAKIMGVGGTSTAQAKDGVHGCQGAAPEPEPEPEPVAVCKRSIRAAERAAAKTTSTPAGLESLGVRALRQQARALGVPEAVLEAAVESAAPKKELVRLIEARSPPAAVSEGGHVSTVSETASPAEEHMSTSPRGALER